MISSSNSDLRYATNTTKISETEEHQSGFRDRDRKPNYVINTISKGSTYSLNRETDHEILPDTSVSWKVLPTKHLTDTDLNTLHNANTNVNMIQSASSSYINKNTLLNQLQQQDLIDINLPHEDTKVYNTQASNSGGVYSMNSNTNTLNRNHHRPQQYSSMNPIDYGSTYNTNEGYLNDNNDLHQVRFATDVIIKENTNEEFEQYDPYVHQERYSSAAVNSNPSGNFGVYSKEITNSEMIRNKQYINSNNFTSNYIHEVNNTSFVKYDSDV